MKNFIIWVVIAIVFFGSIIYFVFSSDKSLAITYIKFDINPQFIIGVDSNDVVKIYNPLNDDAKILNLGMFNNKSLESSMEVMLNQLKKANFLDVSQIDITVITKNEDKINYYYEKINRTIQNKNYNLVLVNHEASHDELLAYSNEVAYDLKPTYDSVFLNQKSIVLQNKLNSYIDNLIEELFIEELTIEEKNNVLKQRELEGYFNNYDLTDYKLSEDDTLIVNNDSDYNISFIYDENGFAYSLTLNLVLEYQTELVKNDEVFNVIEEYHFTFGNNQISNLKYNFYKFN